MNTETQNIINAIPFPCLTIDAVNTGYGIVSVNPFFTKRLNIKEDQLIGNSLFDIFRGCNNNDQENDLARLKKSLNICKTTHKEDTLNNVTLDLIAHNQTTRHYLKIQHTPVCNIGNKVEYIFLIITNCVSLEISKPKAPTSATPDPSLSAAMALNTPEYKYKELFNLMPEPAWVYDTETLKFVEVNETAIRNYGYSNEEFLNMTLLDLRPTGEIPALLNALEIAKSKNYNNGDKIFQHLKKDGTVIYAKIKSANLHSCNRNYRMAVAMDVTEIIKQQTKLEEANYRLKTAQDIACMGYWQQDAINNTVEWTDEIYAIYEIEKGSVKLTSEQFLKWVHPEDLHLFKEEITNDFQPDNTYEINFRIITDKGNTKWLQTKIKIEKQNGQTMSRNGIVTDITRQKNDELALCKKTALLTSLNELTTGLLKTTNWLFTLDSCFSKLGNILNINRICYYEKELKEHNGSRACKLKWEKNATGKPANMSLDANDPTVFAKTLDFENGKLYDVNLNNAPEGIIKNTLNDQSIKALIIAPIFVNEQFYGFISFQDCETNRVWDNDERLFLQSVASAISTVIGRNENKSETKAIRTHFESLIQNLPGISIRRKAGGMWPIIFMNDEVEQITGYPASDFVNNKVRAWESIIHPEDLMGIINTITQLRANEEFMREFRVINKEGNIVWLKGKGRGIPNEDGKLEYVDGIIIDITKLKERQLEIERQNTALREIAWIQSHVVRAPLASLMGLVYLLQANELYMLDTTDLLNKIKNAANDLDTVIRSVIKKTEDSHVLDNLTYSTSN